MLGNLLDADWKRLIRELLGDELADLIAARQGFLLRVGRHSGAESVTLDGVRDIKIIGPKIDGKQTFDSRANTTQRRFASLTKAGSDGLLPFGWLWVDACGDEHRHLHDALRHKLAARSNALRDAHQERLSLIEGKQRDRAAAKVAEELSKQAADAAVRAAAEAEAARRAELAAMSPNRRRIEEFKLTFAARAEQLRGGRERQNGDYHNRARKLAQDALQGSDWSNDERHAAADAITEWLPKVVEKID